MAEGHQAEKRDPPQLGHMIDVARTILQAAGLPEPKMVNGTPQIPMEGRSLMSSFENAKAREARSTQYFEIAGNRAIYHDGGSPVRSTGRPGSPNRAAR